MIAFQLLTQMGMPPDEIAVIISAIGNHEETTGYPVNYAASAVILADKSDVHFSRVQNPNQGEFDIHDRVNFATQRSRLRVMPKEQLIELNLEIDTSVASLMEYFEIFLERMVMCRRAAEALECQFHLMINSAPIANRVHFGAGENAMRYTRLHGRASCWLLGGVGCLGLLIVGVLAIVLGGRALFELSASLWNRC
jgi:hypothetical protein